MPLPVGISDLVTAAKMQTGGVCLRWVLGFEVAGLEAFARVGSPSMGICGLGQDHLLLLEIKLGPWKGPLFVGLCLRTCAACGRVPESY